MTTREKLLQNEVLYRRQQGLYVDEKLSLEDLVRVDIDVEEKNMMKVKQIHCGLNGCSGKMIMKQAQRRAGDEGSVTFFKCSKCGKERKI